MESMIKELRKFVIDNFLLGNENGLEDNASFLEQGILDSTGVLEMVNHLEERYNFKVEDNELIPENLDSITALVAFIARKRSIESS